MTWYLPEWPPPTVFMQAVATGDLAKARAMIDAGFEWAGLRTAEGDPPMILAGNRGHPDMVRLLIENGAGIGQTGSSGWTILHYAGAVPANVKMLDWLLGRGAALEARAATGATPLLAAIGAGCVAGARSLLTHGADATACDQDSANAVFHLVHALNLFRKGADHWPELALLGELLARGVNPNARGWLGHTAVTEATELGRADALALLCDHGGDPNGTERGGLTALQAAAIARQPDTAALLLQRGARLDVCSATALGRIDDVRAMVRENPGLVRAVLAPRDTTVLSLAIAHGHPDLVRLLLDAGADPNGPNLWTSCLHAAVIYQPDPALVTLLIERGAEVDAGDGDGNTPLNLAAREGALTIARILLDHGADVNSTTERGHTPLMFASTDEMRALLRARGGTEPT